MKQISMTILGFLLVTTGTSAGISKGDLRKFRCNDEDKTIVKIFEYFPNHNASYCLISNRQGTVKTAFGFSVKPNSPKGYYEYFCGDLNETQTGIQNVIARIEGVKGYMASGELNEINVLCKRIYELPLL